MDDLKMKCTEIDVEIRYGDQAQNRTVSPGTPISSLLDAAIQALKPEDFRNRDYVLQITPSDQQPDANTPVGALVEDATCSIKFNLVSAEKGKGQIVEIKVNNNSVKIAAGLHTGAEIKSAAIAQDVKIEQNFVLSMTPVDGGKSNVIGDEDEVNIKGNEKFRAIASDTSS